MLPVLARRPLVLAYHGVDTVDDDADPRRLVVSPRHLEEQVRLLLRMRFRVVTAGELADGRRGRVAVLTFDDGWLNWLTVALPLLQRLGVRATFFVCPGWLGGQHPGLGGPAGRLLGEDGVRALHEAGMEIGSHSLSHPDLRRLDDDALRAELEDSKSAIERLTGSDCRTFAYPYGFWDDRVASAAGEAGYALAFGWLPGRWRPLAAPRLPGPPRHGALRLGLKLLGLRRPGR
ncbi:MAG: polysaccharide deacetylase family protein [Gaiellaceae bacterium]